MHRSLESYDQEAQLVIPSELSTFEPREYTMQIGIDVTKNRLFREEDLKDLKFLYFFTDAGWFEEGRYSICKKYAMSIKEFNIWLERNFSPEDIESAKQDGINRAKAFASSQVKEILTEKTSQLNQDVEEISIEPEICQAVSENVQEVLEQEPELTSSQEISTSPVEETLSQLPPKKETKETLSIKKREKIRTKPASTK